MAEERAPCKSLPPPPPAPRALHKMRPFAATWLKSLKSSAHVEPKTMSLPLPSSSPSLRLLGGVPLKTDALTAEKALDALEEYRINGMCRRASWGHVATGEDDERLNRHKRAGELCCCGRPAEAALRLLRDSRLKFRVGTFAFEKCAAVMEISDSLQKIQDARNLRNNMYREHETLNSNQTLSTTRTSTGTTATTPSTPVPATSSLQQFIGEGDRHRAPGAALYNGLVADFLLASMDRTTSDKNAAYFKTQAYELTARLVRSLPEPLYPCDVEFSGHDTQPAKKTQRGGEETMAKRPRLQPLLAEDTCSPAESLTQSFDTPNDGGGAAPADLPLLNRRSSPSVFSPAVMPHDVGSRSSLAAPSNNRVPQLARPHHQTVSSSLKQCDNKDCLKIVDHRTPLHRVILPPSDSGPFKSAKVRCGGSLYQNLVRAMEYYGDPHQTTYKKPPATAADAKAEALKELQSIWGIGPSTARKLHDWGVTSVSELRGDERVLACLNKQQRIGLKHREDLLLKIPRAEVDLIQASVRAIANAVYAKSRAAKGLQAGEGLRVQACGSYRRGNLSSGDVDILITPESEDPRNDDEAIKLLDDILIELRNVGFLTDDLTVPGEFGENDRVEGGLKPPVSDAKSYMGVCRLPAIGSVLQSPGPCEPASPSYSSFITFSSTSIAGSPPLLAEAAVNPNRYRRIDIKAYPKCQEAFALLYFTGDAHFNRSMRAYVKRCGMTLTDAGLALCKRGKMPNGKYGRLSVGRSVRCKNEQQIFDILGIPFVKPEFRDTKKAAELCAGGGCGWGEGAEDDISDDEDEDDVDDEDGGAARDDD